MGEDDSKVEPKVVSPFVVETPKVAVTPPFTSDTGPGGKVPAFTGRSTEVIPGVATVTETRTATGTKTEVVPAKK